MKLILFPFLCLFLCSVLGSDVSDDSTEFDGLSCGQCVACCAELAARAPQEASEHKANVTKLGTSHDQINDEILEKKIKALQESLMFSEAARIRLKHQLLAQKPKPLADISQQNDIAHISVNKNRIEELERENASLRESLAGLKTAYNEKMSQCRHRMLKASHNKNHRQMKLFVTQQKFSELREHAAATRVNVTLILEDASRFAKDAWERTVSFGDWAHFNAVWIWDKFIDSFQPGCIDLVNQVRWLYRICFTVPATTLKRGTDHFLNNSLQHSLPEQLRRYTTEPNTEHGNVETVHSRRLIVLLWLEVLVVLTVFSCWWNRCSGKRKHKVIEENDDAPVCVSEYQNVGRF